MKILPFLILPVFLTFCSKKSVEYPAGIIAEDTMVMVLSDIHVAQADIAMRGIAPDSADKLYQLNKHHVYTKYGVDEDRFRTSYAYYLRNIDYMERIYSRVVDSLALKETEFKAAGK